MATPRLAIQTQPNVFANITPSERNANVALLVFTEILCEALPTTAKSVLVRSRMMKTTSVRVVNSTTLSREKKMRVITFVLNVQRDTLEITAKCKYNMLNFWL